MVISIIRPFLWSLYDDRHPGVPLFLTSMSSHRSVSTVTTCVVCASPTMYLMKPVLKRLDPTPIPYDRGVIWVTLGFRLLSRSFRRGVLDDGLGNLTDVPLSRIYNRCPLFCPPFSPTFKHSFLVLQKEFWDLVVN